MEQLYGSKKDGDRVNQEVSFILDSNPSIVQDAAQNFAAEYSYAAIKPCTGGSDWNFIQKVRVLIKRSV